MELRLENREGEKRGKDRNFQGIVKGSFAGDASGREARTLIFSMMGLIPEADFPTFPRFLRARFFHTKFLQKGPDD